MAKKAENNRLSTEDEHLYEKRIIRADKKRKALKERADHFKSLLTARSVESPEDGKEAGNRWKRTRLPLLGMFKRAYKAATFHSKPNWIPRSRKYGTEQEKAISRVGAYLLNVIFKETDIFKHMNQCVDDGFPSTLACMCLDFDTVRVLPRGRRKAPDKMLYDTEGATSPMIEDLQWAGYHYEVSRDTAKKLFPDHKFETSNIGEESSLQTILEGTTKEAKYRSTERVKLVRIDVKGEDPNTDGANLDANIGEEIEERKKDKKSSDSDPYSGTTEVLWFEDTGNANNDEDEDSPGRYVFIKREPLPFILDTDELPYAILRLAPDADDFYGHSVFEPYESMATQANWAATEANTDAMMSVIKKLLVSTNAFDDEEDISEKLLSDDSWEVIEGADAQQMKDAVQLIEMGKGSHIASANRQESIDMLLQTSGYYDLAGNPRSHKSATGEALDDKRANLQIGEIEKPIRDWVEEIGRKLLQIARSRMTVQDVAKWVPESLLNPRKEILMKETVDENGLIIEEPELDEAGNPIEVWYSDAWPEETAADIRREIAVEIEARSLRFVSEEQVMADMEKLFQTIDGFMNRIMGALSNQMPEAAKNLAQIGNAYIERIAHTLNIANSEELAFDLNSLLPPIPEPQPAPAAGSAGQQPAAGPSPEQAGPGSGLDPQQIAQMREMAELINSGQMDPASVPPEVIEMAKAQVGE